MRDESLHPALLIMGLTLLLGCDRSQESPFDPTDIVAKRQSVAGSPSVLGSYTATAVTTLRSTGVSHKITCAEAVSIATQTGDRFSGTFTVQASGDCDQESGTLAGTVGLDGRVIFTADTPGGGADVWEDGAARQHCRLVSSTPFTGTVASGSLSAAGSGVYDCPTPFGTARVNVDVQLSATRA